MIKQNLEPHWSKGGASQPGLSHWSKGDVPWSPWLKALQTGTTRTLMWIARIQHSKKHIVRSASSAITKFGIKFLF